MKLCVLVGCSSSGKDLIMRSALEVVKDLKPVTSHTTRPMREGEQEGKEYYFIDIPTATDMLNNDEFIESRQYNVANGETWLYGIHKGAIDIESDNKYICIVDAQGLKKLERYLDSLGMKECITSIYIDTNAQLRLQRSLMREGKMSDEQVKEVIRRFENDELFVSTVKYECDYLFKNNSVENAIQIVSFIKDLMEGKYNG